MEIKYVSKAYSYHARDPSAGHAAISSRTIMTGQKDRVVWYLNGKLKSMKVTPVERKGDVIVEGGTK